MPGDLRRALRSLARRRTYAAAVVLTLALAISLPVVVLSTLDRHFWRPPDLIDADRLFTLQLLADDGSLPPLSHPEYEQLRAAGEATYSLAGFGQLDFTLVAGGAPVRATLALVSPNFFTVLGAQPRSAACRHRRTTVRTARPPWFSPTARGRRTSAATPLLPGDPCAWADSRSR